MKNGDDLILMEKYLKGDEKSLEILIQRYLKPIYGFSYKYVANPQEAEDITQEVFVKVWKNLKKLAPHRAGFDSKKGSFKSWIFSIARNTAIDFLKKKRAVPFSYFENENGENALANKFIDSSPLPNKLLEREDAIGALAKAINKLLPKYRKILLLRHNDDLTFREISQRLNEPLNTVKSRHRRALLLLKKLLP